MALSRIISILSIVVLTYGNITAQDYNATWRWWDRDWGAGLAPRPFKSYSDLFIDIDSERELKLWEEDELRLYSGLALKSVKPGFFLIEFTTYPIPAFSAWLEENRNGFYHEFDVGDELNLLRSLVTRYEEPWSLSLFSGELATFWDINNNEEVVAAAKGAAGFVLTAGTQQLLDNSIVNANWMRLEWRLKGEGKLDEKNHTWDMRIGYKWYGIPEIPNRITVGMKRKKRDKRYRGLGLRNNSHVHLMMQVPASDRITGISRLFLSFGKVFPLWKGMVGFKFGFVFDERKRYNRDTESFGEAKEKEVELFFQPLLEL